MSEGMQAEQRNPYEAITQLHKAHVTEAKQAIQKAYIACIKVKSYTDISVKELCENAHVARSTFYAYYQNVNDVLEEIENELILDFLDLNAGFMEQARSNIDDLRFFEATIAYIQEQENSLNCLLVRQPEYRFIEKLKTAIKYHFWERNFKHRNSKEDELILDMVASVTISAYAYGLKNPYEPNMERVLDVVSNILKLVDHKI